MTSSSEGVSRRGFLTVACTSVVGIATLTRRGTGQQATQSVQWTQPGGGPAGTAWYPDATGPTDDHAIAWKNTTQSDVEIGAVVDGSVYAAGRKLTAYDAVDGTEQWSLKAIAPDADYGDSQYADIETPSVTNDIVLAPVRIGGRSDSDTVHTSIVAVDAASGSKRWHRGVSSAQEFSPLAVVDRSAYCCGPALSGADETYVYRLDAQSGSVVWQTEIGLDASSTATPIIADGRVFVHENKGIVALDATSGARLWTAQPKVAVSEIALVTEEMLVLYETQAPGSTVIAVETTTGNQLWKQAYASEAVVSVEAVDDQRVFLTGAGTVANLIALDRTTGNELWETDLPGQPDTPEITPRPTRPSIGVANVGSTLFAGTSVLDPAAGTLGATALDTTPIPERLELAAVVGGRSYFHGDGLYVLETADSNDAGATESDRTNDSSTTSTREGQTTTSTRDRTDQPTRRPSTSSASDGSLRNESSTTTTNGPGFGVLAGVAGIVLAGLGRRSS